MLINSIDEKDDFGRKKKKEEGGRIRQYRK
jgi:hypothetical protein